MTSILSTYKPTYDEKLTLNSFFMCRYLSNHPQSVFVGNMINIYYNQIPLDRQYDFAKQLISGRITFIQNQKKEKIDTKITDNISRYYKVSEEHAIEYMELMDEVQRQKFKTMYDGS